MLLSLDCLTLTDTAPSDAIHAAGRAGFDLVSIWVQAPAAYPLLLCDAAAERACAEALDRSGVAVHAAEVFDLGSEEQVAAYRPALERAARVGARVATAINGTNPDYRQVVDLLACFTRLAREVGLGVNVEPIAMGRTRTLAEARRLIADAGVDAGIVLDTWHLIRTGGGADEIRAIEPELFRYVQINDGALMIAPDAMIAEARGERLYPGDGAFPLVEMLRCVPRDIPWAIETPSIRRAARGMSAQDQASAAIAALRGLVHAVEAG